MSWETIVLEREGLYAEVWALPAQAVAKRYGISGPALAKICRRLGIPVPPRGYWARKAAGHGVRASALPPPSQGTPTSYRLTQRRDDYSRERFAREVCVAIENAQKATIVVPENLTSPHALVKASSRLLRSGLLKTRAEILAKHRCLDVVASRGQITRALRIMDTVLKTLEAQGLKVDVTEPELPPKTYVRGYDRHRYPPSKTGVHIGEAFITFALEEELETVWPDEPKPGRDASWEERWAWRSRHGTPGFDRVASGRLALKLVDFSWLGAPRSSWRDGKKKRLEDQLGGFVAGALELGERHRLWRIEREQDKRRYEEGQRRAAEAEMQRQLEAARVKDLDERLKAWTDAEGIESLASACEHEHGHAAPSGWIAWARARAADLRRRALSVPGSRGEPSRA